jgi:hypothetical protein
MILLLAGTCDVAPAQDKPEKARHVVTVRGELSFLVLNSKEKRKEGKGELAIRLNGGFKADTTLQFQLGKPVLFWYSIENVPEGCLLQTFASVRYADILHSDIGEATAKLLVYIDDKLAAADFDTGALGATAYGEVLVGAIPYGKPLELENKSGRY